MLPTEHDGVEAKQLIEDKEGVAKMLEEGDVEAPDEEAAARASRRRARFVISFMCFGPGPLLLSTTCKMAKECDVREGETGGSSDKHLNIAHVVKICTLKVSPLQKSTHHVWFENNYQ